MAANPPGWLRSEALLAYLVSVNKFFVKLAADRVIPFTADDQIDASAAEF
jgi:hypothetical protein